MAFNLGFDLDGLEDYMGSHLRVFISFTVGLLVFVGLIALSVFFIAIRGKEEVMVPDVQGKELTAALIDLQKKELYPQIQLRAAAAGEERGIVLEQIPEAGTLVKAERRISLVISQGMALDRMGNFVGRNINDVRQEILAFNGQSADASIAIREPFMYQYSPEPAGTVLQQNPLPGAEVTGATALELVVSRGGENTRITVPLLTDLSYTDALAALAQIKAGFTFTTRETGPGEKPGVVFSQSPPGGTEAPAAEIITVNITAPQAGAGEAAGLFHFNLPRNPYPLPVRVEAELPNGNRQGLVSTNHAGGAFSVPYRLPAGSVIILSMVDREIFRQTVAAEVESLSPEEL
ncbi:MAG: PASTA domain-containing protein [Treponema sp.]|jgi:beta-lactam-binding protein with PASTA domain|nr:PASTA domain-containing protein [Treponema sp.]